MMTTITRVTFLAQEIRGAKSESFFALAFHIECHRFSANDMTGASSIISQWRGVVMQKHHPLNKIRGACRPVPGNEHRHLMFLQARYRQPKGNDLFVRTVVLRGCEKDPLCR